MKSNFINNVSIANQSASVEFSTEFTAVTDNTLVDLLCQELQPQIKASEACVKSVSARIAREVERICDKSSRIQTSGEINSWLLTLAKHRIQKCLHYYKLGSQRGRVELHSSLGSMVYRHISTPNVQLGFDARY
ncbi:hypothetical protein DSM106972_000550 [Dulcicalothrix desertica PCC 7102]|uniref:Uncharacterized protein n=2 Tax=Dulcicalothrix desertica TaxID=32056 RepID=A0A3S1CKK9_9CYAN|nr:hypothetical protein DSM106972_000550 [Dulcicalothrix desertica PCC 7102]